MKINAIKIDVVQQTVYAVEIDNGLKGMYTAIGCTCVDRVVLDNRNDLWIDDEGLLKEPQPPTFQLAGFVRPLAGNALICGYTSRGNTVSTRLTADQIRPLVTFLGDVHLDIEPAFIVSW